jgi:hypothetical protein
MSRHAAYLFRMETEVPQNAGCCRNALDSPVPLYNHFDLCKKNLRNQGKTHFRWYGKIALTASRSGRSVTRNKPRWFGSGVHSKREEAGGCRTVAPSPQIRN